MPPRSARIAPVLLVVGSALLISALVAGCSKDRVLVDDWDQPPETELTYAPIEADTTNFRVHLYWNGYDKDGEVVLFRFAVDGDTSKPVARWTTTTANDTVFTFSVHPTTHTLGHVFWIVAQDNDGRFDPTPAKRFFSVRTLPPTSRIITGPYQSVTGADVGFAWEGSDPDGGPSGGWSRVESFEYLLLRPGTARNPGDAPLPAFTRASYTELIRQASGASLPPPYEGWTWQRTSETSHRFTGLPLGIHVFALRAVDAAGARETSFVFPTNIRYFTVSRIPLLTPSPNLSLSGSALIQDVQFNSPIVDYPVRKVELLREDPASFAWTATPGALGIPIAGYSVALDDTTTAEWDVVDPRNVAITLPADLALGEHWLFVRAVDTGGGTALGVFRFELVSASFRDPLSPASVLWVDDFVAPGGNGLAGAPNYPSDDVEDEWRRRVLLDPLAAEFGVRFEEWDTVRRSNGIVGRGVPSLAELARHRVVIWSVDLNNTVSSPTGLWNTIVGGISSELAGYVRAGGTLIVTGFWLASQTTSPSSTPYGYSSLGICAALPPGSATYRLAYFPRSFMGLDAARSSDEATRTNGARDFVEARVTNEGAALGFHSAEVDTGGPGTGAKWNPYALSGPPDISLAPGLPKIDGWRLQTYFACQEQPGVMRAENPGAPIAVPLFTYHGVNKGVLQNGAPSSREGLVVGVAVQAHDLGQSDGRPVTPGDADGVMGRTVYLGFPIYYSKDEQAYAVMRAAFAYVSASPTLAGGAP